MRVSFRHGIVRHFPPEFLTVNNNIVDLLATTTDPLVVTIAFGSKDYLHIEQSDVLNAWTNVVPGVDQWLYLDIDVRTGARTFGITSPSPIVGPDEPVNPTQDQHWFDTNLNKMKVWDVNFWDAKIRIILVKLEAGILPISVSDDLNNFIGTQIHDYNDRYSGLILFDQITGFPIRDIKGVFVTSEDNMYSTSSLVAPLKIEAVVLQAVTGVNILKNSIVTFTDYGIIRPANEQTSQNFGLFGIIQHDAIKGELVDITIRGVINSDDWDWSYLPINSPLYINSTGMLVDTPTIENQVPVAVVINTQSIVLGTPQINVTSITNPPMTTSLLGIAKISVPPVDAVNPIVVGDNDPRLTDARDPIAHNHPISDITNLQTELDSKLSLSGGLITGSVLAPTPTVPTQIVNKDYVDARGVGDLSDATITNINTNDILKYNGTKWINTPIPSSNVTLQGDITGSGTTASAITTTLASVITPGTYTKITVDEKGRATVGTTLSSSDIPALDWSKITSGQPTTLAGYGIGDAVANASGTPSIYQDVATNRPVGTSGQLFVDSTNNKIQRFDGVSWIDLSGTQVTLSGDVTGTGSSSIVVTLNTVPISKGGTGQTTASGAINALLPDQSLNSGNFLTTNGTVASWSALPADAVTSVNGQTGVVAITDITGNAGTATTLQTARNIAVSGAVSGSASFNGSADATINTSLATVNTNVGSFGSATQVGLFTVTGTGLITAASNATITPDWTNITSKPNTLVGYGITDAAPISHVSDGVLHLTTDQHNLISAITVSATEINYLSGATGNIQTQIGGILPIQTNNSGKYLTTDGTNVSWATVTGGASALNDLTDVVITTPTTGQVVKYNGTTWINDTDAGSTYTLPIASSTVLGGVKIGPNLTIDGTGVVNAGITGTANERLNADANFANVRLLIHCEGTSGSQVFTDSSSFALTVNTAGNAFLTSTNKKMGAVSALFDGVGDYLYVNDNANLEVGASSFTLECWIYMTGSQSGYIFSKGSNFQVNYGGLDVMISSTSPVGIFNPNSANATGRVTVIGPDVQLNTWTHIAYVRNGNDFRMYTNGVGGTPASGAVTLWNSTTPLYVGCWLSNSQPAGFFTGYMDDIRVTIGTARYTTDFTPPLDQFPDSSVGTNIPLGGSVMWNSSTKFGGDANFIWDSFNSRLGVNTATPTQTLDVTGNILASGTITGSNLSGTNTGDQTANDILPTQTNNSGKYLTTDGTNVSWATSTSGLNDLTDVVITTPTTGQVVKYNGTNWINDTDNDTVYTLPIASNLTLGGVKVGSNLVIDETGLLSVSLTASAGIPTGTANTEIVYTGAAIDPFIDNVLVGLHMDGVNNSTVFTDIKNHTITPFGSTLPHITTANSKFGGASAFFDAATGYGLEVIDADVFLANAADVTVTGTPDFTIESWIYYTGTENHLLYHLGGPGSGVGSVPGNRGGLSVGVSNTGVVGIVAGNLSLDSWGGYLHLISNSVVPSTGWSHIAVTSVSNVPHVFINGIESSLAFGNVSTSVTTFDNIKMYSPRHVQIMQANGYNGATDTTLTDSSIVGATGYIDDLRITKGIARYIENFAVPTAPFYDIVPSATTDPFFDHVSLLLPMDGANNGTTFTDIKNNVLTPFGNVKTSTTQFKYGTTSAYFDSSGDYLTLPTPDSLHMTNFDFTVECWVYLTVNSRNQVVFTVGDSVATREIELDISASNNINLYVQSAPAVYSGFLATANPLSINQWYHIAAVRNGNSILLFVNGILSGTFKSTETIQTASTTTVIGRIPWATSWDFAGYIDDLRITKGIARYTANFTPPINAHPVSKLTGYDPFYDFASLTLHMDGTNNSTTFTDSSRLVHTVVPDVGTTYISTSVSKFGGASGYFDGTTSGLSIGNGTSFQLGSYDYTLEGWVYTSDTDYALISKGTEWEIKNAANNWIYVQNGVNAFSVGGQVTPNNWTHWAISKHKTSLKLYVNGLLVATGTGANITNGTANVTIGDVASTKYAGYMDDVRITKGIARYPNNFTPPTVTFVDASTELATTFNPIGGSVQWNSNGDFGGDNNFIWDSFNNRLGVNTAVPTATLDVTGNILASGTITGSNLSGTNTGDQTANDILPTQTNNSGKYLITDGTNVSWNTLPTFYTMYNDYPLNYDFQSPAIANNSYVAVPAPGNITNWTIDSLAGMILFRGFTAYGFSNVVDTLQYVGAQLGSIGGQTILYQNVSLLAGVTAIRVSFVAQFRNQPNRTETVSVRIAGQTAFGPVSPPITVWTAYTTNWIFVNSPSTALIEFVFDQTAANDNTIAIDTVTFECQVSPVLITGVATLVAGEAIVSNAAVTSNSKIFLTSQVDGGTPGFLRVSSRINGTSFTITSSSNTDTSTIAWSMEQA